MSDFKSVEQLCYENPNLNNHILSLADKMDELERKNKVLENTLIEIKAYYKEFDKFAATVYDPKKSTYKELETKLAQAEELRQKDIDELFETRITPLNKKVIELTQELSTSVDINRGQKNRIKELEIVRDNLNKMIDFAVGYISAAQPHTDKSPMEVKKWFFKGFEWIEGLK